MTEKTYKPHKYQAEFHKSDARFRCLIAGRRGGKAQPNSSMVLTTSGWVCMGNLKVGDTVMTPGDYSAKIVDIFPQGFMPTYKVLFDDGSTTRCTLDHLWKVRFTNSHSKEGIYKTEDLIKHLNGQTGRGRLSQNIQVDTVLPLTYGEDKDIIINPYILGLLLGDGCFKNRGVHMSTSDKDIIDSFGECGYTYRKTGEYDYRIYSGMLTRGVESGRWVGDKTGIVQQIKKLGLDDKGSYDKFIPINYVEGSFKTRLSILRGLMDTDGYCDSRGHAHFYSMSKQLADGVQEIVWSLGGKATQHVKNVKYKGEYRPSLAVYIQFSNGVCPFELKRKADRWKDYGIGKLRRRIVSITSEEIEEECTCIRLDSKEQLYITDDFIVTHNSIAGTIEALYQADTGAETKGRPTKGWIIAPTYPMLKDINIPMVMDWIPQVAIKEWNKQDHRLTLINGSEITFRSGEDPDKLRGIGLDWLWLDEACFMQKMVWDVIYPALTDRGGIAWVTTTPQGYDWVYNSFYKKAKEGDPDYAAWQYRTIDNPYIDKALVDKARNEMNEVMFRQEYLASFEKLTGLVYPDFDEKDHVVESVDGDRDDLYFVGIDVGYTNPTAVVLVRETADHVMYVVDEYYETQKTVKEVADAIKQMVGTKKVEMYVVDPASKATHQETGTEVSVEQLFHENGIPVVPGNNDVRAGIDYVTQLLRKDEKLSKPRLQVLGKCKNVIREFQNYSWPKYKDGDMNNRKEKPEKAFDHSLDALRYVVMSRPDWFERVQRDQSGRLVDDGNKFVGEDDWDSEDFSIDYEDDNSVL